MMRLGMRRLAPGVLAAIAALSVVLRIGVLLNRRIDPDESQHLHVAWLITQGQVPYRDFWEHHLPFFHYAMAPLTLWLTERPAVYFAARGVIVLLAAVAVWLTWRLARRLSADGAVWAAVILALPPQFAETSTETRPDVPALVAHLASLLALVAGARAGRPAWLWAAGAWQGAALGCRSRRSSPRWGGRARGRPSGASASAGVGRVGVAGPLPGGLAMVLGASSADSRCSRARDPDGLYRDVVLDSLRFVDFEKTWPFLGSEIGVFLAAALGLVWCSASGARDPGASRARRSALATLTQSRRPVPSPDSRRLPACMAPAAPGGRHLRRADPRDPGGVVTPDPTRWNKGLVLATVAAAVVAPGTRTVISAIRNQNAGDLRLMRRELRLACPGEAVIDGTALYVFRPAAYRHGALIRGVREWVARGVIPEEAIAGDMRAARAPVAHVDFRIRGMVGPVADLLRVHYVGDPRACSRRGGDRGGPDGGR